MAPLLPSPLAVQSSQPFNSNVVGTQIMGLLQKRADDEEQIDLDPEPLTLITQKQWNMQQARGNQLLQITENPEMLIRTPSEQAAFARTVQNGPFYITNESVMDGKQFCSIMQRIDEMRCCVDCRAAWQALVNEEMSKELLCRRCRKSYCATTCGTKFCRHTHKISRMTKQMEVSSG